MPYCIYCYEFLENHAEWYKHIFRRHSLIVIQRFKIKKIVKNPIAEFDIPIPKRW